MVDAGHRPPRRAATSPPPRGREGNRFKGGASLSVLGLTWEGCDYLDAVRDERVWRETKRVIAESVGSATMAVVKTTAVKVMERLIDAAI